ncbi:MAG TPA: hypothetical protein VD860_09935 [Azospirillum sp.]|nr:hypothetical protein [Azospirillum sp.]
MGLLMLATLFAYAAPGQADRMQHHGAATPHEHVLADADAHAHAHVAVAEHEQGSCKDLGVLDDGACCNVAQCVTMHGGVLAAAAAPFIPRMDRSNPLPALATPDGILVDPALRPPCLTV